MISDQSSFLDLDREPCEDPLLLCEELEPWCADLWDEDISVPLGDDDLDLL